MPDAKSSLPALFPGATHRILPGGQPVKAVQWNRDGDHPQVSRYPIERREFKGVLVIDARTRFALRFGEWICEDADGRMWVEQALSETKFVPIEGEPQ